MKYYNDCMDTGGLYIVNGENGKTASYVPYEVDEQEAVAHIDEFTTSGIDYFGVFEEIDPVNLKSTFTDLHFGYKGSTLEEVVGLVMETPKESGWSYE